MNPDIFTIRHHNKTSSDTFQMSFFILSEMMQKFKLLKTFENHLTFVSTDGTIISIDKTDYTRFQIKNRELKLNNLLNKSYLRKKK